MNRVALSVIAAVATIWFLRAATPLLVPVAIAVCVSYALEPVVAWMARVMPRLAAASLVMLLLLASAGFGVYSLRDQALEAVEALPRVTERLRDMMTGGGSGPAATITEATRELQRMTGTQQGSGSGSTSAVAGGASNLVWLGASSAVAFAGNLVTVVFLVFFLLVAGDHFARRIIEISGSAERRRTASHIVRDINRQIQRFLLVRAFTGVIVALATWAALAWLDTPQAAVWAILAGIFNSIPYFGPVIVSGGLFLVGILQGGGLRQAMEMSGAALVITSLEGWLLTPPLLGKTERMSAVVIFLGLLLWTWLWGAWGTLLAVPMLVVVKAIADHVERLRPISRLMAP